MAPLEWPQSRSIARCVFPVFVGPSTALTFWGALRRKGAGSLSAIAKQMWHCRSAAARPAPVLQSLTIHRRDLDLAKD